MTTNHLEFFETAVRIRTSPFKPYFIGLFYYLKIRFCYANILSMTKIENIEQFAATLSTQLLALRQIGDVAIPCASPQPWNDARFQSSFRADGPRYVVPDWEFSSYPSYDTVQGTNCFAGIRISVNVSNATMGGHSHSILVKTADELVAAVDTLLAFRDQALKACRHRNHSFVANLGRCYNQYKCNDCGVKFNIDSSD